MKYKWIIACLVGALASSLSWADATKIDVIPELKDIEKIAAEQEAAIRAQTEALKKAQLEKELAERATKEAIEKQKEATTAPESSPKPEKSAEKKASKGNAQANKKTAQAKPPIDPWLAQERRYTFP